MIFDDVEARIYMVAMSYSKGDAPDWIRLVRYLWTNTEMTH